MPQFVVAHLEILADPNRALVRVQEPLLQLLGRIAVGARFAHCAVDQYRRAEPAPDIGGLIRGPAAHLHGKRRTRLVQERLRSHCLRGVRGEVIAHEFQKCVVAHTPAQRIQE